MGAVRIAIVTESFLPRVDGVSRSVEALLRHCGQRGHDVVVIAPGHGPHEAHGYPVVRVMGVPALYPGLVVAPFAPGMRTLLERFAPDVVHLASPAALCASAARAARAARIPIAAHFQTDVAAYARHYGGGMAAPLVWRWLRRIHNRCAVTYAPTEAIAATLREHRFRNVTVCGRGVDGGVFRPGRPGADAARGRWAPGEVRVLCVSRLAPEKSLSRLVALAAAHPELSVLLVGAGPEEAALRRAAPPNLRLAGLLEGDALADVYSAADIFAFPSSTETFGQVVQEAMASGLPVVGMRRGGIVELVTDGVTGLVVEPDGNGFDEAVLGLAADPARRLDIGQAGAARMASRSWAEVLDPLLDDYGRLRRPRREGHPVTGTPGAQGRAAAFMDVDRTLVRGSCFLALAGPFRRAGLVRRRTLLRAAFHQAAFAAVGASQARVQRSARSGAAVVAGMDAERLREVGAAAVRTTVASLVYPAARRLIEEHHAAGEPVFLVSSAPEEVVAVLASLVGADGVVATRVEVVDGRYTGTVTRFVQGHEKVRALRALAEQHGLDLRRCTAYGDSLSDAPMLASVGRGVCVNPDRRLRGLARMRGWEIRRFHLPPRELGHPGRLAAVSVTLA